MEFIFDLSELEKFERITLNRVKKYAFPLAIKNTLNSAAFDIRGLEQKDIKDRYTLRNAFTEKSIRVDKITTLKISDMVAVTGSIAPYMSAQEEGRTEVSKGKYGLRIPTPVAAGQAGRRTKPIKPSLRRGRIKLNKKIKAKNKKQFILMSVRVAALRGQSPYVFLPLSGKKTGIYRVFSSGSAPPSTYRRGKKRIRRSMKWGKPKGRPGREKLLMIHSFSQKKVVIGATNSLQRISEKVVRELPEKFRKESDKQFNRFVI